MQYHRKQGADCLNRNNSFPQTEHEMTQNSYLQQIHLSNNISRYPVSTPHFPEKSQHLPEKKYVYIKFRQLGRDIKESSYKYLEGCTVLAGTEWNPSLTLKSIFITYTKK